MGTKVRIPSELKWGPFTLAEARAAGVSATALQGKSWRRIARGIYCWAGLADDPLRFLFAYQRLVPEAVYAGTTAAWLYGIDVDPIHPIEIIVPPNCGIRTRPGLIVRHMSVTAIDVTRRRGLRATTALRTIADVCRRLTDVEILIVLDQALRRRLIDREAASRLHPLGPLAEPAESPMETRLRWLLLKAGLPRPQVQTDLHDRNGAFVGRADLYYPDARLVIEFDGGNHRERLVEDNRRQNLLIRAGYRVLRFTSADVYSRPQLIIAQVREELSGPAAVASTRPAAARR